jgi:hypothetical protein
LNGCLVERLFHAWTEDSHHHLFEGTQESSMVPAQDMVRGISERLHAFLPLLLGCSVTFPWQQHILGISFFKYGTPLLFFLNDSKHFC